MRVRLVPVGEIFRRMPFVVRDLARDSGKRVQLELAGQATEIDKFLVERMMDPVLHLVRNAISHGIETPRAARRRGQAAGRHHSSRRRRRAGETVMLEISRRRPRHRRRGGGQRARALPASTCPTARTRRRARCSTSSARQGSRRATRPTARAAAASAWPSCATRSRSSAGRWPWRPTPGHGTTFRIDAAADAGDYRRHHRRTSAIRFSPCPRRRSAKSSRWSRAAARVRAQRADAVSRRHAADGAAVRAVLRYRR